MYNAAEEHQQTTPRPTVGVVGMGPYGERLTELAVRSGLTVTAVDCDPGVVRSLMNRQWVATAAEVTLSSDLTLLSKADVIFEAIDDDLIRKECLLRSLSRICGSKTIFALTSRRFALAHLALVTDRPANVVGLRSFQPPQFGDEIEVVATSFSTPSHVAEVSALLKAMGLRLANYNPQTYVAVEKLIYAHINRCARSLTTGSVTAETLDKAHCLGLAMASGPLRLADTIGIRSVRARLLDFCQTTKEERFSPAGVFRDLLASGKGGQLSGAGFYNYLTSAAQVSELQPRQSVEPAIVRIGIIGSGSLARQIAQLFATFGREVLLVTRDVSRVDIARRAITEGFDQAEKRGLIERSEAERAQSHIHFSGRHSDLIDCELVVEAVPEDLDVKRLVLARAGESCTPETLLATTTSSFRVSDISIGVSVPERVLGLHFFKPATVMKLVEIIGGTRTKKENIARADIFCRDLQKIPVVCEDTPGFLVNGLLFAYLADALELLLDPLVDEVEVDRTIAAAFGYPCGPIELMKWIGWGMCGDIIHNLSKYGLISSAKWRRAFVCLEQAGDASRMHSADDYEATLIEAQCGARAIT